MRVRLGLAGLLAFEAILTVYSLTNGWHDFAAVSAVAAGGLAWALAAHARGGALPRLAIGVVVLATLVRAMMQTVFLGVFPASAIPAYFVPLGFALVLWPRAGATVGVGLVAAARTWFLLWYFQLDATALAVANLAGAAGAWVWWADAALAGRGAADEVAPQGGA